MSEWPPSAKNFTPNKYLGFMVKHIVTFKLNGTPEQRLETSLRFKDALLALPGVIDVLESMEVGVNSNPDEDWDVVLTAVVSTMDDVAVYAKHPAHVAAASIIAPLKAARACVDYEF